MVKRKIVLFLIKSCLPAAWPSLLCGVCRNMLYLCTLDWG